MLVPTKGWTLHILAHIYHIMMLVPCRVGPTDIYHIMMLVACTHVVPSGRNFSQSTGGIETGNVQPIEAIFCKFGNIVTSISFVISSLSCNAMLSSSFLASKV